MIASGSRLHAKELGEVERLRARVDELEMLLEVTRGEVAQAERAHATLRELVQLVSHDMRSPLGALRLRIDRLARRSRGALGWDETETAAPWFRSMRRLTDLLDTLMEFCRAQECPLEPCVETFDLTALVRAVVADADASMHREGLHFATESEDPLPPLRSDPIPVRLVLLHLLLHAAKQNDLGPVLVSITADGESHRVAIGARATRAAASEQAELVDLSAVDPDQEGWPPGTKLVFIAARELVTAFGGRLEANSESGGFGAVTLTIPSTPVAVP